ncbi:MAG: ATP-binding protein [Syntrophobacterales bacterium]|jgi:AAA+ ATPase superfamily predicted ATPase|nr:ATP-binding protein [Syntrophobacterales bacterium]
MRFYDRTSEIAALQQIEQTSAESAQMTMMVGRRRVGKTTLLKNAFKSTPVLYFFVARKNEVLLCEEFSQEISNGLGIPVGSYASFAELFRAVMQLSLRMNFTLIIDEFQEFRNINSSVFSDMQNIWDSAKDNSKINLVLCGSIYSMMKRIFENSKEPLFGRITARMIVKPFATDTIKEIVSDHNPKYSNEDLLAFYMVTGGVAKYIEHLVNKKAFTSKAILGAIFQEGSSFIDEGRNVLIDEFGKDYGNYFSILSLIASSKSERGQIEGILNMDVGGHLERLEKEYDIIKRNRPFGAKEGSRSIKYKIEDNFLNFWFRFIYKYRSAVEIGNLDYVRNIVERDYETYSGIILEKYFRTVMTESKEFSDIQGYWNSKGENEIDIVAINDVEKRLVFCEVKRNLRRINLKELENKSQGIVLGYPKFSVVYKGLSLDNM